MAALSPALASTVAASIAQQPGRAVQTIAELADAMRTVELLARTTATGGSFESTFGPRLVMPAGLGGLAASVARSTATPTPTPMLQSTATATHAPPRQIASRMPTLSWHAASTSPVAGALAIAEASRPVALHHVAWADRWLARFSGARKASLDVLAASSSSNPESRMQALAAAAPENVFVAPTEPARDAGATAPAAAVEVPITRYDDNAETPDDVFASIAAAARVARTTPVKPAKAAPSEAPIAATEITTGIERGTFADVLAHVAPAAPNAGLSPQLASSPFAPPCVTCCRSRRRPRSTSARCSATTWSRRFLRAS